MWEVAPEARAWRQTFSRSARRQHWRQGATVKNWRESLIAGANLPQYRARNMRSNFNRFFVLFARSYFLIEFFLTFLNPICVLHMDITLWEFMFHLPD